VAFKVTKEQLAGRDVLAADLRAKAIALNAAIAAFNREVGPLARVLLHIFALVCVPSPSG
jgi:hypothetical protein